MDSDLRRVLLALVALGIVGLGAELLLLEHTESPQQWVPLAVLGLALLAVPPVAARPAPWAVRLFQGAMLACVVAGAAGLYFHYTGNAEFEREGDPALRGLDLFWKSMRGATPALAPGALVQLGLLGLACAWRHPALRPPSTTREHP